MIEYTHKFGCEFRVKGFNLDNKRLMHPHYCQHSINPEAKGHITCPYLGKPIEIILTPNPGDKKTTVNLCDFIDGE